MSPAPPQALLARSPLSGSCQQYKETAFGGVQDPPALMRAVHLLAAVPLLNLFGLFLAALFGFKANLKMVLLPLR